MALKLGSRLIGTSIMSLQTGGALGSTVRPIIDPADLKIVAYEIEGSRLIEKPSLLMTEDIRELGSLGMIIDSSDDLIGLKEVAKLQEVYDLNFKLLGMSVIDEAGHKLGKVDDYSVDLINFLIEQINVRRTLLKAFNETGLLINRSQIIEINDKHIIVRQSKSKIKPIKDKSPELNYLNPFRSTEPET